MGMQEMLQLKMKFKVEYRMKKKMLEIRDMNDLNFRVLTTQPCEGLEKDELERIKFMV